MEIIITDDGDLQKHFDDAIATVKSRLRISSETDVYLLVRGEKENIKLASGYVDADDEGMGAKMIWYNKKALDELNIKYHKL